MSTQFTGQPPRAGKVSLVNGGSSCDIDYSSRDIDNVLELPTALRYRVDNLTDSTVVTGWTAVSVPETEGSITIAAATNTMTRQYRTRQLMQVTVEATYANADVAVNFAYYELCASVIGMSA